MILPSDSLAERAVFNANSLTLYGISMSYIFCFLPCFFTPPNLPGALLRPSLALPEPFCGLIFLFESDAFIRLEAYSGESLGCVDIDLAFLGFVDLHSVDDVSSQRQVEYELVQPDALACVGSCLEAYYRNQ